MMEHNLPKHIHQNRPSVILNIDNEYMTYMLMDEIRCKPNPTTNWIKSTTKVAESKCPSDTTSTAL